MAVGVAIGTRANLPLASTTIISYALFSSTRAPCPTLGFWQGDLSKIKKSALKIFPN
jgi:hypothetical protein